MIFSRPLASNRHSDPRFGVRFGIYCVNLGKNCKGLQKNLPYLKLKEKTPFRPIFSALNRRGIYAKITVYCL